MIINRDERLFLSFRLSPSLFRNEIRLSILSAKPLIDVSGIPSAEQAVLVSDFLTNWTLRLPFFLVFTRHVIKGGICQGRKDLSDSRLIWRMLSLIHSHVLRHLYLRMLYTKLWSQLLLLRVQTLFGLLVETGYVFHQVVLKRILTGRMRRTRR